MLYIEIGEVFETWVKKLDAACIDPNYNMDRYNREIDASLAAFVHLCNTKYYKADYITKSKRSLVLNVVLKETKIEASISTKNKLVEGNQKRKELVQQNTYEASSGDVPCIDKVQSHRKSNIETSWMSYDGNDNLSGDS